MVRRVRSKNVERGGVTLAEYFTLRNQTLLFLLGPDDDEPDVVEVELGVEEAADYVASTFGRGGTGVASLDEVHFQELGTLVEPIAAHAEDGATIWLVPHNVLHYVPLHALEIDGVPLGVRNPVCYTSSASVMSYCKANWKGRRSGALVFGDPAGDIGHAREEARIVAQLFGATARVGGDATRLLLLEELEHAQDEIDVLHLSCHGVFRGEEPLDSSIQLAPPPEDDRPDELTAAQIFGLRLDTDLVTLSACESGLAALRSGDELVGLTRALVYAGTAAALVSLWRVDSLSTSLLMGRFYRELTRGDRVATAEALRRAQAALRELGADELLAYCDRRLAEVDGRDAEIELRAARADALRCTGAADEAEGEYRAILDDLAPDDRRRRRIEETLLLLSFAGASRIERPFAHLYYWAPFLLYGDWR